MAPRVLTRSLRSKESAAIKNETGKIARNAKAYDLWEKDFVPKVDLDHKEAAEHYLQFTKKKMPKMPKTARMPPSLLKAVAIPDAGASYNPNSDEYQKYLSKITDEELKLIKEEERIEKANKAQYEKIVTHEERYLEQLEGLASDPRYDQGDNEIDEEIGMKVESGIENLGDNSEPKRKTRKQRENIAKEKKLLREQKKRKEVAKHQHDVFRTKSINKELAKREEGLKLKSEERRINKQIKKMTTRQQLGRGKFREEEDPFLLEEELVDNLRQLKPQGSLLNDRMKSLQRRNILPIAGDRNKRKLKNRLKRKFVEKRSVQGITKDSRVI